MNRIIWIGTGIVLVGVVMYIGYSMIHHSTSSMTCASLPQTPTVVAFGDSLVKGYGAPEGQGFVEKLSTALGVPIQNFGVDGDTTADGLVRVQDVLTARPDVVIVLLGGNDALQQVPVAQTKANLAKIIERLLSYQSKRVRVVLVGVLGGFPSDPYAPMFDVLAKEYGVTYVPNILSGLITNPQYMSDQVHPNAAGYAKITKRLTPIIEGVCAEMGTAGS